MQKSGFFLYFLKGPSRGAAFSAATRQSAEQRASFKTCLTSAAFSWGHSAREIELFYLMWLFELLPCLKVDDVDSHRWVPRHIAVANTLIADMGRNDCSRSLFLAQSSICFLTMCCVVRMQINHVRVGVSSQKFSNFKRHSVSAVCPEYHHHNRTDLNKVSSCSSSHNVWFYLFWNRDETPS